MRQASRSGLINSFLFIELPLTKILRDMTKLVQKYTLFKSIDRYAHDMAFFEKIGLIIEFF
jgi:hypothetical protein